MTTAPSLDEKLYVNRPLRWLLVMIAWLAAASASGAYLVGAGLHLAARLGWIAAPDTQPAWTVGSWSILAALVLHLGILLVGRDEVPAPMES